MPTTSTLAQHPMLPSLYQVCEIIKENHDTSTLVIDTQNCTAFDSCQPGQFNMLYGFGQGEIAISISRFDPEQKKLYHTIRAVGSISRFLSELTVGSTIGLRGPFGKGWPSISKDTQHLCLIAGGMGLAPLRPVIEQFISKRVQQTKLTLIYGARSPTEQIFVDQIDQWQSEQNIEFYATVDHATAQWHGHVGVVTSLIERLEIKAEKTLTFVCGPEIMMRLSANEFLHRGLSSEQIYVSMERSMKCGIGHCGHCQFVSDFICKNGPVFSYAQVAQNMMVREL